jgi:hypothetical protein
MNSAESLVPASICMACSSVEGASTLSEVRAIGLYQYNFFVLLPEKDDALNVPGATSTETGVFLEFRANGVLGSSLWSELVTYRPSPWPTLDLCVTGLAESWSSNERKEVTLSERMSPSSWRCPLRAAAATPGQAGTYGAKNSVRNAATASGASSWARWAQRGIVLSCEPGMALCNCSPFSCGIHRSSSPHTIITGRSMRA